MRTGVALQRHDFDPIAFIFGLLFTVSGLLFLFGRFDIFNHTRWLWPGLLVFLGIAVLVGARGRSQPARPPVEPRPVEDVPDLDTIDPPVGPEAFRLPGWPARGERREEAPTQRLDPQAETEVIEQQPEPEPPEKQ
jgi:hypothetical protein